MKEKVYYCNIPMPVLLSWSKNNRRLIDIKSDTVLISIKDDFYNRYKIIFDSMDLFYRVKMSNTLPYINMYRYDDYGDSGDKPCLVTPTTSELTLEKIVLKINKVLECKNDFKIINQNMLNMI